MIAVSSLRGTRLLNMVKETVDTSKSYYIIKLLNVTPIQKDILCILYEKGYCGYPMVYLLNMVLSSV